VPIVLVILKSVCFLNHALLPRDLKARGLTSARSADFVKFWLYILDKARTFHRKRVTKKAKSSCICEKREVVPRAVKSARYPALLGKSRTFDKIVQN
jgi:hypothetical protein